MVAIGIGNYILLIPQLVVKNDLESTFMLTVYSGSDELTPMPIGFTGEKGYFTLLSRKNIIIEADGEFNITKVFEIQSTDFDLPSDVFGFPYQVPSWSVVPGWNLKWLVYDLYNSAVGHVIVFIDPTSNTIRAVHQSAHRVFVTPQKTYLLRFVDYSSVWSLGFQTTKYIYGVVAPGSTSYPSYILRLDPDTGDIKYFRGENAAICLPIKDGDILATSIDQQSGRLIITVLDENLAPQRALSIYIGNVVVNPWYSSVPVITTDGRVFLNFISRHPQLDINYWTIVETTENYDFPDEVQAQEIDPPQQLFEEVSGPPFTDANGETFISSIEITEVQPVPPEDLGLDITLVEGDPSDYRFELQPIELQSCILPPC